ncbi:uncharacterized protein DUF397 [Actinomadura pelletieri DSM 43383]|uniref:Uncharacterized protein DUF397 n=1 Tax=Actinomadura pelletieri DSM 43383 TaxID=1120940 RepID=A0A495QSA8_9ACTN|nr:DUF397 domain-containing protein [Actinomadura pelletieri]RKS76390.1 uncharacterized protein DUF397 [Actinomadura pelletieri DSM 43383]
MHSALNLIGASWRKSSHSTGDASTCVEVATNLPAVVAVRDSTDPTGPALLFTPATWRTFTDKLKRDEL